MILVLLAACTETEVTTWDVTMSPDVSTVATVAWTTDRPVRGRIRFGTDTRTFTTPLEAEAATDHTTVLVGMPADTQATYEILDEDGTFLAGGEYVTGALPAELPGLTVTGGGNDQFALTPLIGATTAAVILSPEGEIVWYHVDDRGLDVYRVRAALDGSGVRYNAASVSGDPSEDSALVTVSWDGATVTETPVPLLAHDFVELDDGTIGALQVKPVEGTDGEEVRGDAIVEVTPAGEVTEVWDSWDCFDPATLEGDDPELGWTFANALDHDAATDRWILGMRNVSSLVWIDRATRGCDAVLGGDLSDYTFDGDAFRHQHQFHVFDDHVLVFDNDGAGGNRSRAIEYTLADGVATQVWDYTPDPAVYSFVLGDVTRLDDGDTFVAFSVAGELDRVAPDGTPSFTVNTGVGYAFGFVTFAPSLVGAHE